MISFSYDKFGKAVRSVLALSVAVVMFGQAEAAFALDRTECERQFGAANLTGVDTVRMQGGLADFGDDPHLFGSPRGDAVVCWVSDGRVSVTGRLYADPTGGLQNLTVRLRVRYDDDEGGGATFEEDLTADRNILGLQFTKKFVAIFIGNGPIQPRTLSIRARIDLLVATKVNPQDSDFRIVRTKYRRR